MLFEMLGISMTTGVTTAVLPSLLPIISVISESLILKERTTLLQKIFLVLGVIGVGYIAICTETDDGSNSVLGIIFILGAVLCGSLFMVFSRSSSSHFKSFEIVYFSFMFGAVAFNAVNVVRHLIVGDILNYFAPLLSKDNIIGFLFLTVISTIIATGMDNFSLGRMQITTMAAFSGISTLITIVVGVIFMDERLYYYHFIGLTLILIRMIGVSVIAVRKDRAKHLALDKNT